jgi:hypothetical protein
MKQVTMLNTPLSSAADEYLEAIRYVEKAKAMKDKCAQELIMRMKENKLYTIDFGNGTKIEYNYKDASEGLRVKQAKPKGMTD